MQWVDFISGDHAIASSWKDRSYIFAELAPCSRPLRTYLLAQLDFAITESL